MTRSIDPNLAAASQPSVDAAPAAEAAATGARHVCPFCGTLNAVPQGPCPRCTMENSPQTRKATKARIGPWYVLQTRNPAAPGMKWDTLLGFVRKGRVKPASIVRGPTTHQLWRYASQVKGLSREFGVCYSCGGAIEKLSSICPRCNRLQEPPSFPDALLESQEADTRSPASTLFKEIRNSVEADIVIPALGGLPPAGVVGADVFAVDPQHEPSIAAGATAGASPTARAAGTVATPAARSAVDLMDDEDADRAPVDPMLNVNDLAAAFRLNVHEAADAGPEPAGGVGGPVGPEPFDARPAGGVPGAVADLGGATRGGEIGFGGPGFGGAGFRGGVPDVPAVLASELPPLFPQRSSGRPLLVLAAVLLVGVGLWLWLDDISRRRAGEWFQDAYAALRRTGEGTGVGAHRKETRGSRPKATPTASPTSKASPADGLPLPDPLAVPSSPLASTDPLITAPPAATAPATAPTTAQVARADPAVAPDFPFTAPETPDVAPAPVPEPPPAPAREPEPAPDAGNDLEVLAQQARTLFGRGIDAESRREYAEAVRFYEQVKELPRGVWPSNLELRLRFARSRVK